MPSVDFEEAVNDLPISAKDLFSLVERSYGQFTIRIAEVECLLVVEDGKQFIIPRGTEFGDFFTGGGWRDILRDIRAIPWRSKRLAGWSHAGFLKGARGIVDKCLKNTLRQDLPLFLLGHSLGGALALNCAALLHAEKFTVSGVITLGAPRTFTRRTAKKVAGLGFPIWEFSNDGDPVPDVPFRFWGYRHCNEVSTSREGVGYSVRKNHMLPFYKEAFKA